MFAAGDLHKSSPPDKFTSKSRSFDRNSDGEKYREAALRLKGFFLVRRHCGRTIGIYEVPTEGAAAGASPGGLA